MEHFLFFIPKMYILKYYADQILVVSGGEITERGDHTSLMEENGSFFLKRKENSYRMT